MADYDPTTPLPGTDPKLFARFMKKVNVTDGCWLWMGAPDKDGYGRFGITANGQQLMYRSHRLAWTFFVGPIPGGRLVLHNCAGGDNPSCVSPAHLWLGTAADNHADMMAKGRGPVGGRSGSVLHPECLARGERHGRAKLNDVAIRVIRLLAARGVPKRKLAAAHGVNRATIHKIAAERAWGHVLAHRRPLPGLPPVMG